MVAETTDTHLSLQKQLIYSQYARGEAKWKDVAAKIVQIEPPAPKRSIKNRLAAAIVTLLLSVIVPPWARRDD